MSIKFKLFETGGEEAIAELTERTIKTCNFEVETEASTAENFKAALRKITIKGILTFDDFAQELDSPEIESLKLIANWALTPENSKDCYKDVKIELRELETGNLLNEGMDDYKDTFVVEYEEDYSDKRGSMSFLFVIREMAEVAEPVESKEEANLADIIYNRDMWLTKAVMDKNIIKNPLEMYLLMPGLELSTAYSIMRLYLDGVDIDKELLNKAMKVASEKGEIKSIGKFSAGMKDYDGNTINPNYDLNRYDTEILAWTNYWNHDGDPKNKIDPNAIKTIMMTESVMGYTASSAYKCPDRDVMQSLYPVDPTIWIASGVGYSYEWETKYNIKRKFIAVYDTYGNTVKDKNGNTVKFKDTDDDYVSTLTPNSKYDESETAKYGARNGMERVKSIIVKNEASPNLEFYMLYSKVDPTISIAVGTLTYRHKLNNTNGITENAIVAYNGEGDKNYRTKVVDGFYKTLKNSQK